MRGGRFNPETSGEPGARTTGILGVCAVVLVFAGFFWAGAWLGYGESLFLAPWWMRVVQLAFSAGIVAGAWRLGTMLPLVRDRNGHPQTPAYGTAWLAFVWCCMMSHAVIWGGLHRLHFGTPATTRCVVTATATRDQSSAAGSRDCVTTGPGSGAGYRLKTGDLFALPDKDGRPVGGHCGVEDAQPGDMLDLMGRQSLLGFATMRMAPADARLATACPSRP